MRPTDYPKMVFSFHAGWDELRGIHPSIVKVFFTLVLPFSLVPAVMIILAGTLYGDYYASGVNPKRWYEVASLFFLVELLTVPLMALVIQATAKDRVGDVNFLDSYLVAAIAPIPLWVSALSLFVPNILFNVIIAVIGLLASGSLLYHGIGTILGISENLEAQDISLKVFAVGAIVWAFLIALVVWPIMGM